MSQLARYTPANARFILSHVFCVLCLPEDDGWTYDYSPMWGEALCCRCRCRLPADLRLYVPSPRRCIEWCAKENAAVDALNAERFALPHVSDSAI